MTSTQQHRFWVNRLYKINFVIGVRIQVDKYFFLFIYFLMADWFMVLTNRKSVNTEWHLLVLTLTL
jgi:hypothetical protein